VTGLPAPGSHIATVPRGRGPHNGALPVGPASARGGGPAGRRRPVQVPWRPRRTREPPRGRGPHNVEAPCRPFGFSYRGLPGSLPLTFAW